MQLRSCSTLKVQPGELVLVRTDYNVPLESKDGKTTVADDTRVRSSVATLKYLTQQGAKVVICSHLGRPKGPEDSGLSLKPCVSVLESLGFSVNHISHSSGAEAKAAKEAMAPGSLLLLENIRFDPREKKMDKELAQELSDGCVAFVNEAFSVCHRSVTSTVLVPQILPSFAGFALESEVAALSKLLDSIERPFVVVVGGAKLSDKVAAVTHLAQKADVVLLGGAVANTFLKAEGTEVYRSFVEEATAPGSKDVPVRSIVEVAQTLLKEHSFERILKDNYIPLPKIIVPIDVLAAPTADTQSAAEVSEVSLASLPDTPETVPLAYFDIGPKTRRLYQELLLQARTVFWNGPLGLWENQLFSTGTKVIGQTIAGSTAYSVIGGGDTIAAVQKLVGSSGFDYLSTGGGASLELLSGRTLPGIAPLIEQ